MNRRSLLGIAGLVLAACTFDTSGIATPDGRRTDAGPISDAPLPGDAGDCPSEVQLELAIDGVTAQPSGVPYVHVLPGDIVELSARGSCGQLGAPSYEWQISPIDDTRGTALPDLSSETITVYPVLPKDYTVTLTVQSGAASASRTVLGMRVHGFARHDNLPGDPDVRDLAMGGDTLWIAHARGAHRSPLGPAAGQDQFFDLSDEVQGAPLGTDLGAVHYHGAGPSLYLAQDARRDDLWEIRLDSPAPAAATVDFSAALGASAQVFDIIALGDGVAIATDMGVTTQSASNMPFAGVFTPPDTTEARALLLRGTTLFAGSRAIYEVAPMGAVLDPFPGSPGGDARVRALEMDRNNREAWVASDGNGAARLDIRGNMPGVIAVYDASGGALTSDRLRHIAVEPAGPAAGDAWAATSVGVARYIRARDTWLLMDGAHGLEQRTNTSVVAIDSGAMRRTIFVGTRNGLVSLRAE